MSQVLTQNSVSIKTPDRGYSARPITETIINGFFTVDQKWTVTYWNKAAEKLLGVEAKNIIGKNLWQEFAEVIPLDFYTVYHKAFLQDIPFHFQEYWGEMGTWFDVINYHCDDTLSVCFKTSEPQNPERPAEQLRTLNKLYRFITEVTNDCLWEWDLQLHEIFWVDGGHKKVFGYDIENALIPQTFWESRIHPEDRERVLTRLHKTISTGVNKIWEEEYRFQKTNREYAYVHDRGRIIYDDENKACRMVGATEDITSRKLAELQLQESEKKLGLIAKQTNNAFILTDADDRITWVNSAFTRMTGYKSQEVIGRRLGSFLQGKETSRPTLEYLREKIKGKQSFDCEILNYSKSGNKIWMHVQGQPLLDEDGICLQYFVIQTDITEKVLLENKLMQERTERQREITDAILTAQENERDAIGRELHDNLNQVLGAAKLYVELAKTDEVNRLMCLNKSSGYILEVINEIRKICKTWAAPGKNIMGLFESIKILIEDLSLVHPIKIEFIHDGFEENELNEKLQLTMYRIVQEQLNNVLKHAHASQAVININRIGKQLSLTISDNGKGCDITQVKNGTGIMNIESRTEMYDGNVTIQSKPGGGYELKVVLAVWQ